MSITAPVKALNQAIKNQTFVCNDLCLDTLEELGFQVIPKCFNKSFVDQWYGHFSNDNVFEKFPRHVSRLTLSDDRVTAGLSNETSLVRLASKLFAGNAGCTYPQIFRKNSEHRERVILHNDIMYMSGSYERFSVFVALTPITRANGGLILYPGTHHLGLLGDAGELNKDILPKEFSTVCPDLQPGDALIMHAALWHESYENMDGSERVYLEIKLSKANDPTAKIHLCGEQNTKWQLPDDMSSIFVNSRIQRIMKLLDQGAQL